MVGEKEYGIDHKAVMTLARRIKELYDQDFEIGIVLGGGNIFRGIQQGPALGIGRTSADQIGMLATLINGKTLQQAIKLEGVDARLMTALECPKVAESYTWEKMMRYLVKRKIVIFAGGTGHPYFTTDSCAALRASEMGADIFLKCTTRVDGIYSADPRQTKDAKKYDVMTYKQVLDEKLGILDLTAVTLCMEERIPIRVFNLLKGSFLEALEGKLGSMVKG